MHGYLRSVALATVVAVIMQAAASPAVNAKDLIQTVFKIRKPRCCHDVTVERLAMEIDWLEKHIDNYGSIVAKQPDIWGQARLTRHRQEVESQLFCKLNQFHLFINGTISRSDQTFVMDAFALSSAASSPAAASGLGANRRSATPVNINNVLPSMQTPVANSGGAGGLAAPSAGDGGGSPGGGAQNGGGTPSNQIHTFTTSGNPFPISDFGGNLESQSVALEPTVALDQLNNYLNHLNELRRINEGDDTADSPGYSLNLVRIPVSVLPGRATRKGYGAEITITAEPHLSDALLPSTFRSLIINDLVDQLGLCVTRLSDAMSLIKLLRKQIADPQRLINDPEYQKSVKSLEEDLDQKKGKLRPQLRGLAAMAKGLPAGALDKHIKSLTQDEQRAVRELNQRTAPERAVEHAQDRANRLEASLDTLVPEVVFGPSSRSRQSSNPIPPSQVVDVFGADALKAIAAEFADRYTGPNVRWNGPPQFRVHPLDVHRFLQDEFDGAYELLSRDAALPLWDTYINYARSPGCRGLADEIRGGHTAVIGDARREFLEDLRGEENRAEPEDKIRCIDALAWAIIVEAAVLNDRLIKDMLAVAQSKGCPCMAEGDTAFYRPQPSPEASQTFNHYVLCRWPVHVFALEPVTDDQNIADKYSATREMQLTLSLAFVTGKISASNMLQYARKLQTDMETIMLNRTAVAFSHGNDTFGWRFYPRFQSPPTPGNLRAFAQTVLGSSPDQGVCTRQLEPGMRECHAVVIMPSFVPYVTFDVRSNWFRLTHHHGWLPTRHHVEQSMVDITKLSRSIQAVRRGAGYICDSDCYRPGEVERLLRRVRQLDRELPLQTMLAQVPVENTIGGYQMFSHGVTDLAPDLYGWYGGPGIVLDKPVLDETADCVATPKVRSQSGDAGASFSPRPAGTANAPAMLGPDSVVEEEQYALAANIATLAVANKPLRLTIDGEWRLIKEVTSPSDGAGKTSKSSEGGTDSPSNCPALVPPGTCRLPSTASCDQSRTTIFLVGNHFSVHQTMVIAGDKCIPDPILLSRQVMQVTIPRDVRPVLIDGEWFVDVHVATPYGVTSHLHVPVANSCGRNLGLDAEEAGYLDEPSDEAVTPKGTSFKGPTLKLDRKMAVGRRYETDDDNFNRPMLHLAPTQRASSGSETRRRGKSTDARGRAATRRAAVVGGGVNRQD